MEHVHNKWFEEAGVASVWFEYTLGPSYILYLVTRSLSLDYAFFRIIVSIFRYRSVWGSLCLTPKSVSSAVVNALAICVGDTYRKGDALDGSLIFGLLNTVYSV